MKKHEPKSFLVNVAYKLHPKIGKLYESAPRFFNDGIVELLCLIISNVAIFLLSFYGFVELGLVLLNLCIVTPITFCIKFMLHKNWVWKKEVKE
jgi:hypothetical protein